MSDLREAFEALRKLSNAIESEWADEYFEIIKAALSANGGEAVPVGGRVQTNPGARSAIYKLFDSFEIAMEFSGYHENVGSAEPLYTHPTPPSVAVPESEIKEILNAVAHIGVDFGYGPYQIEEEHIVNARKILDRLRTAGDEGEE